MKKHRIGLFLCLAIGAVLPQAQAQYSGSLPTEHGAGGAASTSSVQTNLTVSQTSLAATSGVVSTATIPARLQSASRAKSTTATGSSDTKMFNPNSGSFHAARRMYPPAVSAFSAVLAQPGKTTDWTSSMPKPNGAKKGHWVAAAPFSMSGMPSWVEEK